MQAITPALAAILKDHFQAGASGFRGRVRVDLVEILDQPENPCNGGAYPPTPSGYYPPNNGGTSLPGTIIYYCSPGKSYPTEPTEEHDGTLIFPSWGTGGAPDIAATAYANLCLIRLIVVGAGSLDIRVVSEGGAATFAAHLYHYGDETPGDGTYSGTTDTPLSSPPWSLLETTITVPVSTHGSTECVHIIDLSITGGSSAGYGIAGATWLSDFEPDPDAPPEYGIVSSLYRPKRISIDKSLRMTADQATVEFANEDLPLGWGPDSLFPTNSRLRVYQWFGEQANAVCTFTGLIDAIVDSRDPLTTAVTCRDMMALLLDQTFGATAPQGADEDGAVRTEANGVYLSREVSYIVADILDRAGWPTDDRAITPTSYVLDEYVIPDGTSWAEAIVGEAVLTGLVGYDAWADEAGVFHFAPTFTAGALTEPGTPAYTFQSGVDILSLQDATDQYDLRTRVKVRGPLTTQTLTDTWRELWRTRKISKPVGIWYDPSDSANIRVLDRGTKRLYKLRQSDRVVLSSVNIGAVITYPLGISGDPSDATIYWVLNGPWLWGSGSVSQMVKVRKSDNHVLARYNLDTDHWSSIKVSGAYIYVANLTDDRVYRRSKTDGSAVDSFRHTYGSTAQSNPSGVMIDGTTINVFWSNSGTTARFLQCAESAPGTVTKVVKTAGTALVGGEMDTTTHTECWGGSDSLGLVAKFTLVAVADVTNEVYAEVVDTALEDELGTFAQSENRTHDTHTGDADHAFEIRRDTLDVTVVTSLAQATETAMRRLDKLSQRRRVLDVGIVGNPALQKTDFVRVEDPVTGIAEDWSIDTYRSEMAADSTYLGTLALLPVSTPDDTVTDEGDATE